MFPGLYKKEKNNNDNNNDYYYYYYHYLWFHKITASKTKKQTHKKQKLKYTGIPFHTHKKKIFLNFFI